MGKRFEIAEEIFTDSDSKNKTKDHIFGEVEGFANHFFSGEIKQNYGGRANIGYEIKGFSAFISGGYVLSSIDYQESGNQKQSVSSWSPFIGVGIGYDITKNVGVRLNSMFYNFDFKPKNSEFRNTEIDVTALSLGLAVHF